MAKAGFTVTLSHGPILHEAPGGAVHIPYWAFFSGAANGRPPPHLDVSGDGGSEKDWDLGDPGSCASNAPPSIGHLPEKGAGGMRVPQEEPREGNPRPWPSLGGFRGFILPQHAHKEGEGQARQSQGAEGMAHPGSSSPFDLPHLDAPSLPSRRFVARAKQVPPSWPLSGFWKSRETFGVSLERVPQGCQGRGLLMGWPYFYFILI